MIALVVRRLLQSVIVMLTVALIGFTLFRYVGDPVAQMVGQETSLAERAELRQKLGLNDGVVVQFARYVGDIARGRFGFSYAIDRPVGELILERLPATLELSFVAALYALLLGIPMGVYSALHPDRLLTKAFLTISLVGISLPTFFIGILLILVFGVWLGLLPTFGRGEVVDLGWWTTGFLTASGWKSLLMPAFTLGMFQLTLVMRLVRSEMLEVLRNRLHQVRAGAGPEQSRGQFRARPEEHAGAGDHHHPACSSARSSPSRSSPKPCSNGPAWACCSCRRSSSRTFR